MKKSMNSCRGRRGAGYFEELRETLRVKHSGEAMETRIENVS